MGAMHVGLFTECYRPIQNGVVASVDALACELRAGGHEVTCVTPRMPNYREVQEFVVRVPSLPLPTRTAYRLTIPFVAGERGWRALERLSIVHTHSAFVTGWMGLRLARRLRVPLVFTYHTQLEEYVHYVPFDARATRSAAAHLTRTYANAADAVVVPTAAMEARLRALGVTARIAVVPSGIDLGQFAGGRAPHAWLRRGDAQISTIDLTGNENFFIYWWHMKFSSFLFNSSLMVPGQRVTIGGPFSSGAVTVKRVVLRHEGHTGTWVVGSTDVGAATFQFNSNGLAGVLFNGPVTVYTTPFTHYLGGLSGLSGLTGNTALPLRVVGLVLKDPISGQPVFVARSVELLTN